jgi:hypothetical protein
MTTQITDDQRRAIEKAGGSPVSIADPATNIRDVLLRVEEDEKMKRHPDRDDVSTMYPLLADISPEEWEDASLFGAFRSSP